LDDSLDDIFVFLGNILQRRFAEARDNWFSYPIEFF